LGKGKARGVKEKKKNVVRKRETSQVKVTSGKT